MEEGQGAEGLGMGLLVPVGVFLGPALLLVCELCL